MVGRSLSSSGRAALALGVLVATACVPDATDRSAGIGARGIHEALGDAPCIAAVQSSLSGWGAGSEYLAGPPAGAGIATLRFPTRERGVWVVVQGAAGQSPSLQRVDAEQTTLRSFGAECVPHDVSTARARSTSVDGGDFDDRALDLVLDEAVATSARGVVVYAWSPHMPLSVDGWAEVAKAARALSVVAVPALIDEADMDFAEREAERVGIPRDGLRAITSVELIMRDLQLHAPAILVFRENRVSPVLPGYRNADGYQRFLETFLGAAE